MVVPSGDGVVVVRTPRDSTAMRSVLSGDTSPELAATLEWKPTFKKHLPGPWAVQALAGGEDRAGSPTGRHSRFDDEGLPKRSRRLIAAPPPASPKEWHDTRGRGSHAPSSKSSLLSPRSDEWRASRRDVADLNTVRSSSKPWEPAPGWDSPKTKTAVPPHLRKSGPLWDPVQPAAVAMSPVRLPQGDGPAVTARDVAHLTRTTLW